MRILLDNNVLQKILKINTPEYFIINIRNVIENEINKKGYRDALFLSTPFLILEVLGITEKSLGVSNLLSKTNRRKIIFSEQIYNEIDQLFNEALKYYSNVLTQDYLNQKYKEFLKYRSNNELSLILCKDIIERQLKDKDFIFFISYYLAFKFIQYEKHYNSLKDVIPILIEQTLDFRQEEGIDLSIIHLLLKDFASMKSLFLNKTDIDEQFKLNLLNTKFPALKQSYDNLDSEIIYYSIMGMTEFIKLNNIRNVSKVICITADPDINELKNRIVTGSVCYENNIRLYNSKYKKNYQNLNLGIVIVVDKETGELREVISIKQLYDDFCSVDISGVNLTK